VLPEHWLLVVKPRRRTIPLRGLKGAQLGLKWVVPVELQEWQELVVEAAFRRVRRREWEVGRRHA